MFEKVLLSGLMLVVMDGPSCPDGALGGPGSLGEAFAIRSQ